MTWISHELTVKIVLDQVVNRRNDRYLAWSVEEVQGIYRTKHPAQVMVLGVVALDGKEMDPYFFKPDDKINARCYVSVLRTNILPWIHANYPGRQYVWQQDGAPAHTSKLAQAFCTENFSAFWRFYYFSSFD